MTDIFKIIKGLIDGTAITTSEPKVDVRWLINDQSFDDLIEDLFKTRTEDDEFCERLYSSLTNTLWTNGETFSSFSFRTAAGFIADMRGFGEDYIDFYCCAPEGNVCKEIEAELNNHGWRVTE